MNALETTPALLSQASSLAQAQDISVLSALAQLSGLEPDAVLLSVAQQLGYPVLARMADLQQLQCDFDTIGYTDCVQRSVLVARLPSAPQEAITLVLGNPFDGAAEDWALRRCAAKGLLPTVVLSAPDALHAFFVQQEQQLRAMDGFEAAHMERNAEAVAAVITLSTINSDASAVVKLLNSTIYDALKLQASDIHLECDAGCLHVLYRIDGVMVPITQVQGQDMAEQVVSRVKVMAELDIAERRVPQDGRFKVRVNGRDIDFRVSVMPNIFGEDAVLRLLDRQSLTEEAKALRLDNLGLGATTIEAIRRLAKKPHGMLLVTGPTGSGKTTTLYGAITEIHTGRDKIITIEDPVEYRLPRVLQIPVNEKKGLTFARGLRSILR
jgi:general secretion pathway protein E